MLNNDTISILDLINTFLEPTTYCRIHLFSNDKDVIDLKIEEIFCFGSTYGLRAFIVVQILVLLKPLVLWSYKNGWSYMSKKRLKTSRCGGENITIENDPAVAAIDFALATGDGLSFLRLWHSGEFDAIRRGWPDAPESVFIGADPLFVDLKPNNDKE